MLNYRSGSATEQRLTALLHYLVTQPNRETSAPNAVLARHIGLGLDAGRIQNRRLSELLAELRSAGFVRGVDPI
jgi:hypothetical protein